MNPRVSIIVPIYNVEKYLKQCLDSLVNQTLEDIEIICVNDGSTDSSLAILEEYASKDSRIQIISQENRGLSGARNTGMKYIKGEYTFFVDSDDWIEVTALEDLYNKAHKLDLDMLFYQVLNYYDDTGEFKETPYKSLDMIDSKFDDKIFTYEDISDVLFNIPHSAFNKLYKSSFLKDIDVTFPEGLNYEDILFHHSVFLKAPKSSVLRKKLYFYRIRKGSITSSAKEKSLDIFKILNKTQEIFNETDILDNYLQNFLKYLIVNFKYVYSSVDENFKNNYLDYLKKEYNHFNLNKVDQSFNNWHYSDIAFYKAILPANNYVEFNLIREVEEYKFLTNHYKTMSNILQNKIDKIEKKETNEPATIKNRLKKIFQ